MEFVEAVVLMHGIEIFLGFLALMGVIWKMANMNRILTNLKTKDDLINQMVRDKLVKGQLPMPQPIQDPTLPELVFPQKPSKINSVHNPLAG